MLDLPPTLFWMEFYKDLYVLIIQISCNYWIKEEMEKNKRCNDRHKIRLKLNKVIERLKCLDEMFRS